VKIPLKQDGELVAEVKFSGVGPITAQGNVQKVGDNADTAKRIRDLVTVSRGMSLADTTSPQGPVKYWTGFWGWLGGLSVVLPSIGVWVDWEGVDYP